VNTTNPVVAAAEDAAEAFAVVAVAVQIFGIALGPLVGSPQRNISPPIGAFNPALAKNCVVLKSVLTVGTGTFSTEKFAGCVNNNSTYLNQVSGWCEGKGGWAGTCAVEIRFERRG